MIDPARIDIRGKFPFRTNSYWSPKTISQRANERAAKCNASIHGAQKCQANCIQWGNSGSMTRLMIKLAPEWRPDRDRNALTFILSEQKSENGHVAVSKRGAPSRYAIGVASMWPILGVGPIAARNYSYFLVSFGYFSFLRRNRFLDRV